MHGLDKCVKRGFGQEDVQIDKDVIFNENGKGQEKGMRA